MQSKQIPSKEEIKSKAIDEVKKDSGPFIAYILADKWCLYLYHIADKTSLKIPIKVKKQHGCDDLVVGSLYFLIGGYEHPKDVFSVDLASNYTTKKRADLKSGRIYSNSTTRDNTQVYTIGGRSRNRFLTECERYSIQNDKWTVIKPLNVPRDCATLGVLNCQYVYVIEGRNEKGFSRSVEKLDTLDEDAGWIIVTVWEKSAPRVAMGGSWCIQRNTQEFLIVGGTQSFAETSVDDVWILNAYTGAMKEYTHKLPSPEEIYSPAILYKGSYYQLAYCYENPNYDLVRFSTVSGKFYITESKALWDEAE